MSAFATAIDALFADPNLARDATYEPADGDPFPVRRHRAPAGRADRVRRRQALVGDQPCSMSG